MIILSFSQTLICAVTPGACPGRMWESMKEYFKSKPTNKDVQAVLFQGEDTNVALLVVQLLVAQFTETTDGLILLADIRFSSFLIFIDLLSC